MSNKNVLLGILAVALVAAVSFWVSSSTGDAGEYNTKVTAISDDPSGHSWVTVANASIKNGNAEFKRGDTCVVDFLGSFSPKANVNGVNLVVYGNPGYKEAFGTGCPNGTAFTVGSKGLEDLWAKIDRFTIEKERNKTAFLTMIHNEGKTSGPIRINKPFGWVRVVNYDGVDGGNGHHEYGDHCSLFHTKGPFYRIGTRESDNAELLKYQGSNGFGAECPTGTLFWATPSAK